MTKYAALYQFFSGFGLTAYPDTAVPDDVIFPYLTYSATTNGWDAGETALTVNLWYNTESESIPNAKAQEIAAALGTGGKRILCDGGFIWLKRGSPWCQSLTDETTPSIKRRYINVSAEYMTEY
jgi:hypothetical protein